MFGWLRVLSGRGLYGAPMAGARQKYRTVPISEVPERLHPRNRREGDVGKLVELIRVNGFVGASIVQESTGFFVAGNHRSIAMVQAAQQIADARTLTDDEVVALGDTEEADRIRSWRDWPDRYGSPSRLPIIERAMTDEEAERHLIADNVASDVASWDTPGLVDDLDALLARDGTLTGTGFEVDDLDALRALLVEPESSSPSDGGLLARTDVSVADPTNIAERGAHYRLGKHDLFVVDVMVDWSRWRDTLVEGSMFVPYPGPYLPLSERAMRQPLVMVQPDAYIAGHILDKWVAVNGDGSYELVEDA